MSVSYCSSVTFEREDSVSFVADALDWRRYANFRCYCQETQDLKLISSTRITLSGSSKSTLKSHYQKILNHCKRDFSDKTVSLFLENLNLMCTDCSLHNENITT